MSGPNASPQRAVEAKVLASAPGIEAYLLPVSAFPTPEAEVAALHDAVEALISFTRSQWGGHSELFLQFNQFHLANGATRFTQNARAWMPEIGLAVCPHDPPPSIWSKEEFESLEPGVKPRPLGHKVFGISSPAAVKDAARQAMFDIGAAIELVTADGPDALAEKTSALLLPPIQEPVFRSFPLYVPLLRANSFENASASQVQQWLCGASLYMRQSAEDTGIVIASMNPVRAALERAGVRVIELAPAVRG
jgi:hypothetical protein